MSNKAWNRNVSRRRRRAVTSILRAYAGQGVVLIGRGPAVEAAKHELNRAMARHLALWLTDIIPPDGATVRELAALTGAGKKTLRRRLLELEAAGQVERRSRDADGNPTFHVIDG